MDSKIGIHFYSYTKQDKLVNNIHKAFLGIEGMARQYFSMGPRNHGLSIVLVLVNLSLPSYF